MSATASTPESEPHAPAAPAPHSLSTNVLFDNNDDPSLSSFEINVEANSSKTTCSFSNGSCSEGIIDEAVLTSGTPSSCVRRTRHVPGRITPSAES